MQGRTSTLGGNITANGIKKDQFNDAGNNDPSYFYQDPNCQEEEDIDVPDLVEEIIELLLSGLRDTVCLKGELPLCTDLAVLVLYVYGARPYTNSS